MEDQVEGFDVEKVKTEPDNFEDEEFKEDMKALVYEYRGERINACKVEKVKTESKDLEEVEFKEDKKAFDEQGLGE